MKWLIPAGLLLAAPAHAADLFVDPGGTGYTSVMTAYAAASSGDRILIADGIARQDNPRIWMGISIAVLVVIARYLGSRRLHSPGGDALRALYMKRVKDFLIALGRRR